MNRRLAVVVPVGCLLASASVADATTAGTPFLAAQDDAPGDETAANASAQG